MCMVGFCQKCKILSAVFLFLWVPMGMGYSCWENEEKGENYVISGDVDQRHPHFIVHTDEIPADVLVRDTTIVPCISRQFIYRLRPPYEFWDYSWQCCFMDEAEWAYVYALNRYTVRQRKWFESREWEKYLVPYGCEPSSRPARTQNQE